MIFLATSQWFVRMDGDPVIDGEDGQKRTLRQAAQHAIDHQVKWIPSWGRDRIFNMVTNRPDWCISRQRAWGVPIPAVDCEACREAVLTPEMVRLAGTVFEQYGADAWYERPLEEFLPPGLACPKCGGTSFEREQDILDVWFDSGSSHEAVLPRWEGLRWPSDMYLEGSDQHRGWFQSSLLVALATRGRPPFKEVLTHGFLIDLEGRKMSKSVGNVIAPQAIIKESGAEIIRLWVAMTEFTEELRVSKEILTRVVDTYRKLRNTCRILVANLYDFDPAVDMRPLASLEAVDRFALARFADAEARIRRALRAVRLLHRRAEPEHAGHRGPERLLRGRDQGPDVHLRRRLEGSGGPRRRRCTGSATGWRACWRRSCRSRPTICGGTCPAGGPSRSTSRPSPPPRTQSMRRWCRRGIACSKSAKRERRAGAETQGQGDRHVPRRASGADGHRTGGRAARSPPRRPADAVHRLGPRAADSVRRTGPTR